MKQVTKDWLGAIIVGLIVVGCVAGFLQTTGVFKKHEEPDQYRVLSPLPPAQHATITLGKVEILVCDQIHVVVFEPDTQRVSRLDWINPISVVNLYDLSKQPNRNNFGLDCEVWKKFKQWSIVYETDERGTSMRFLSAARARDGFLINNGTGWGTIQ